MWRHGIGIFGICALLGGTAKATLISARPVSDADVEKTLPPGLSESERKNQLTQLLKLRDKALKALAPHLVNLGVAQGVIGEPMEGFQTRGAQLAVTANPVTLLVGNPKNPASVPYSVDAKNARSKPNKDAIVSLPSTMFQFGMVSDRDTLYSRAEDYKVRKKRIDELEKAAARDPQAAAKLSVELSALREWLESRGFDELAQKTGASAAKIKSISTTPVAIKMLPDEAASINRVQPGFLVGETPRVQMYLLQTGALGEDALKDLLNLSEDVIRAAEILWFGPNKLPAETFREIAFGPEDPSKHVELWTKYFGQPTPRPEAQQLAGLGGMRGKHYLSLNRTLSGFSLQDMKGFAAHELGHTLADLAWNPNPRSGEPAPWISEFAGITMSILFLGTNNTSCVQFLDRTGTVSGAEDKVEISPYAGAERALHEMALGCATSIEQVAATPLRDLKGPTVAKAWSFLTFLFETDKDSVLQWISVPFDPKYWRKQGSGSALEYSQKNPIDLAQLRLAMAKAHGLDPGVVFTELEKRWRTWAQNAR